MNNQNLFQISADFGLTQKPRWLDAFRAKYDLPYDYHITFKTTTNLENESLEKLKTEIQEIADSHESFTVVFDELFIAPASSGWCIMIRAKKNDRLLALQKEIVENFAKYGTHLSDKKAEFEKNFDPHITIGRHLTDEKLEETKKELGQDLICEARIESVTLSIAEEDTFEQWAKAENRIFYKLK